MKSEESEGDLTQARWQFCPMVGGHLRCPGPFFSSALSSRGRDTWREAKPKGGSQGLIGLIHIQWGAETLLSAPVSRKIRNPK